MASAYVSRRVVKTCRLCGKDKPHLTRASGKSRARIPRSACIDCLRSRRKRHPHVHDVVKGCKCDGCVKIRARLRESKTPKAREHARRSSLACLYGMSLEDYRAMHASQGGLCAICRQPETATRKGVLMNLAVDHCHTTGAVRGLLCVRCNRSLDCVERIPGWAESATAYLARFSKEPAAV